MLNVQRAEVHGVLVVQLGGRLEDGEGLRALSLPDERRDVLVETSAIELITSGGVRELMSWVRSIEQRSNQLYWARLSASVAVQARMVKGLLGQRARVLSVLAPYYCSACDLECSALISVAAAKRDGSLGRHACHACSGVLELDELELEYLRFIQSLSEGPIAPAVEGLARMFDRRTHAG